MGNPVKYNYIDLTNKLRKMIFGQLIKCQEFIIKQLKEFNKNLYQLKNPLEK